MLPGVRTDDFDIDGSGATFPRDLIPFPSRQTESVARVRFDVDSDSKVVGGHALAKAIALGFDVEVR